MVRVNNKEFTIYRLDNLDTINLAIASAMNTLPEYLYFPDGPINLANPKDIRVIDLLDYIRKNGSQFEIDPVTFINKFREIYPNLALGDNEIKNLWITQTTFDIGNEFISEILENTEDEDIKNMWSNREGFKRELENKIGTVKQKATKVRDLYKIFEDIPSSECDTITEFRPEKISINLTLQIPDITIIELFNYIVLNREVPFATCKDYYKIMKDFIPSIDWESKGDEKIVLRVNDRDIVDYEKHKDYNAVTISKVDERIVVSVVLNTVKGFISRSQFIDRVCNVFPSLNPIKYDDPNEVEVIGTFFFLGERLNTYVFSDLILNDHLFSTLINIDESDKSTKKKSETGQPWIYIHFNHFSTGHITAAISQKNVERNDPEIKKENEAYGEEIMTSGDPYIRVRITKARDNKSIKAFQDIFCRLIVLYKQRYDEIVEEYQKFIPDFGTVVEYIEPVKKRHKDVAPEIFVSSFSRSCPGERMVQLVDDDYTGDDIVMKFPRDKPTSGKTYPSDGAKQYKLICPNPEYKYIGLQENKTNPDYLPYVPCCFKTDQDKPGSIYRHYFYNEDLDVQERKKQQDIIRTNKILSSDKHGKLSDKIDRFFTQIETELDYEYLRYGVLRTPSSFLNAVMVGLYDQIDINLLQLKEREIEKKLTDIRRELSLHASIAKQSCYDMDEATIRSNIMNENKYLDPRLYLQLLESYFDCTIYLFSPDQLLVPRHIQGYYQYKKGGKTIFIYEHLGSESDQAQYPQCELIIRWNKNFADQTEYSFENGSRVVKVVSSIFNMMTDTYTLNKHIEPVSFPIDSSKPIGQVIDDYGKTRCILLEGMFILTSPIPPMDLPIVSADIQPVDYKKAKTFLDSIGEVKSRTPNGRGLNGYIGNVYVTIPVNNVVDSNLLIENGMNYTDKKSSIISIYNKNKKTARYIVEYMFWIFSHYIHDKGIDYITDKVLAQFAKENIVEKPDFVYKPIQKTFSKSGSVMLNNKLVVTSIDMLKRMMYVLKLFSIQDIEGLRDYRNKNVIQHYYVDITDFDQYSNQIILQGENTIDKWIRQSREIEQIHSSVIQKAEPYFFLNENIDGRVFLAQNTQTLENAIEVALTWQRKQYVDTEEKLDTTDYQFTLYVYRNENDINVKYVSGKKKPRKEIRILGYKLESVPYFTVLLDLGATS